MGVVKQYMRFVGQTEIAGQGVSFESGQQGAYRTYFPYPVRLLRLRSRVTTALAASDAGSVTLTSSAGAVTNNTLSHAAGAAFGTELITADFGGLGRVIPAGGFVDITSAKTTAGGRVHTTVEYVRA